MAKKRSPTKNTTQMPSAKAINRLFVSEKAFNPLESSSITTEEISKQSYKDRSTPKYRVTSPPKHHENLNRKRDYVESINEKVNLSRENMRDTATRVSDYIASVARKTVDYITKPRNSTRNLNTKNTRTQNTRRNPPRASYLARNLNPKILNQFISESLNRGLEKFIKENPNFKGQETFLAKYIDTKRIPEYLANSEQGNLRGKNINYEKIKENLADYIANGELFTEDEKEFILRKRLNNKPGIGGWFKNKILKNESYIDKAADSFSKLKNLLDSGDYSSRMPELESAVNSIYDARFLGTALNILYEDNKLDKSRYKVLKTVLKDATTHNVNYATNYLEQKIKDYKIAASIISIIGIVTLIITLPSLNLTGAVIGSASAQQGVLAGIWGAIVAFAGIYTGFKLKNKFK